MFFEKLCINFHLLYLHISCYSWEYTLQILLYNRSTSFTNHTSLSSGNINNNYIFLFNSQIHIRYYHQNFHFHLFDYVQVQKCMKKKEWQGGYAVKEYKWLKLNNKQTLLLISYPIILGRTQVFNFCFLNLVIQFRPSL